MKPQPLPVEMLATDDQRRLAEATETSLPIPASMHEDCQACIRKIYQSAPEFDRPAAMRKSADVERVLSILDSLEVKGGAR